MYLLNSDEGLVNLEVPSFATSNPGSIVDWNYTTTNQPGLGGRSIPYPRGRVLGGSSSISTFQFTLDVLLDTDSEQITWFTRVAPETILIDLLHIQAILAGHGTPYSHMS